MSKTTMVATENLYRTVDGEIVREGDKRAAFHVVRAGSQVPEEWQKAVKDFLGDQPDEPEPEVVEGAVTVEAEPDPEPAPPAEPAKPAKSGVVVTKAAKPASSKAVRKPANK